MAILKKKNGIFVYAMYFFQAIAKITCYTDKQFYDLHLGNLQNFENERKYEEVEDALWNVAATCKLSVQISKMLYNTMLILVLMYSIGGSIMSDHYVLIFGYFFPWINPDTFVGYLVNFTYQSTFLVYAYCGLQHTDLCFLFLVMHAYGQLDTMIIYLRKFDLLLKADFPSERSTMNVLFDDIIEKHIKHTQFVYLKYDNIKIL